MANAGFKHFVYMLPEATAAERSLRRREQVVLCVCGSFLKNQSMERGESSNSNSNLCDADIWAKFVPLDSKCSDIMLRWNEMTIALETMKSCSDKKRWCKITRQKDRASALIENKSCFPIVVDGTAVLEDDSAIIRCGSEIILGPETDGLLRYMFEIMPTVEICREKLKISMDPEHAKCPICLNVWHDVVTVAPCLHNFCNGCFSEWLKRCQDKHSRILCPHCRAVVQFVGRNHFLHTIEEDILLSDSSLRRSNEELALLDSIASIKSPLVVCSAKRRSWKRGRPSRGEENTWELRCPQCVEEYNGFQCNESTVHLQCQACGGMMPSRSDSPAPQQCFGCDRAFCGAYWNAVNGGVSDSYFVCSPETLKPMASRTIQGVPLGAHEKNRFERDITEECIRRMGRSLQDVVSEWIRRLSERQIVTDVSRLELNGAGRISGNTHLCRECCDKLVSFLLYWFRLTVSPEWMPPEAREREDCWYGYACRTQHHNEQHARRWNHVCRPTRGTQPTTLRS